MGGKGAERSEYKEAFRTLIYHVVHMTDLRPKKWYKKQDAYALA